MKAKKKPMELSERVQLHMATTERLLALIERCAVLRDAGKVAEARRLFRQVERLNEKLIGLESVPRPSGRRTFQ